jgi:hypothetical protein
MYVCVYVRLCSLNTASLANSILDYEVLSVHLKRPEIWLYAELTHSVDSTGEVSKENNYCGSCAHA